MYDIWASSWIGSGLVLHRLSAANSGVLLSIRMQEAK